MCRSIKILRAPYARGVTDEDIKAAALQYVQIVSGYRQPGPADADAFDEAVERVRVATLDLLERLATPAVGRLTPLASGDPPR